MQRQSLKLLVARCIWPVGHLNSYRASLSWFKSSISGYIPSIAEAEIAMPSHAAAVFGAILADKGLQPVSRSREIRYMYM